MAKIKRGSKLTVIDRVALPDDYIEKNAKQVALDREKPVQEFKTSEERVSAEEIAKSTVFYRNHYVKELRETYNHIDRMKRIDKVFPYADVMQIGKTEALFIDEPITEQDIEICFKKAALMKKHGYNYVIIEKDTTLFDALEQLGIKE